MNGLYKYLQALVVLVLVTTLLGLSSCDKNSVETNTTDTQAAIGFSNITTKAAIADLQDNGFGVWAFVNTMPNYAFMNNIPVSYILESDKWEYSPVSYWINESVFTFIATYPYSAEYYTLDQNNVDVKLNFTETPAQEDFLVATNVTDTSVEGFPETVDLQFKHVLTSVGLNIWRDNAKHTNDQMRIKKVTLGNIRKSGTYSSKTDNWTPGNEKVTVDKVYESFSDNIGAATVQANGTLATGGKPAQPFYDMLLMPQTLDVSNNVSLRIIYEIKRQNAVDWEEAELETYLPHITWEANVRYTYDVVLSSVTDITVYYIQTNVDPWGTPQVGGTVIIK